MDFYVKIEGDKVTDIKNTDWLVNGDFLEIKPKGHKVPIQVTKADYKKITFVKDLKSRASCSKNYVIENGTARLKTEAELAEEKKPQEKAAAFDIHREIVGDMRVEANGEVYAFDHFSMIFFLAEYSLNGQNGFEWKPKGKQERMHTAEEVTALFTAARQTIRDSFTAYNLDRLDILNNADFSMNRLNTELDKQKNLKAE